LVDRPVDMQDRRYGTRLARADSVDLRWQVQGGEIQHCVALLADISNTGASVQSERPMGIGSTLSINYQNADLPGTVKHCVKRGAGYVLGIEFQRGHRWSPPRR
jgi:hypothetical protein